MGWWWENCKGWLIARCPIVGWRANIIRAWPFFIVLKVVQYYGWFKVFMHICPMFGRGITLNVFCKLQCWFWRCPQMFMPSNVYFLRFPYIPMVKHIGTVMCRSHLQFVFTITQLTESVCKTEDASKHHFPLGHCVEPFFSFWWFSQTFGGESEKRWAKLLQDNQHRVAWPGTISWLLIEIYIQIAGWSCRGSCVRTNFAHKIEWCHHAIFAHANLGWRMYLNSLTRFGIIDVQVCSQTCQPSQLA